MPQEAEDERHSNRKHQGPADCCNWRFECNEEILVDEGDGLAAYSPPLRWLASRSHFVEVNSSTADS